MGPTPFFVFQLLNSDERFFVCAWIAEYFENNFNDWFYEVFLLKILEIICTHSNTNAPATTPTAASIATPTSEDKTLESPAVIAALK